MNRHVVSVVHLTRELPDLSAELGLDCLLIVDLLASTVVFGVVRLLVRLDGAAHFGGRLINASIDLLPRAFRHGLVKLGDEETHTSGTIDTCQLSVQ